MICPHTDSKTVTVSFLTIKQLQISFSVKSPMTSFSQGAGWSATCLHSSITSRDIIIVAVVVVTTTIIIIIIITTFSLLSFPWVSSEDLGAANQHIENAVKCRANHIPALPEEGHADPRHRAVLSLPTSQQQADPSETSLHRTP